MDFTSRDKMSKKARKQLDSSKRKVWDFRPTTRIKPSAKIYNRKKAVYEV